MKCPGHSILKIYNRRRERRRKKKWRGSLLPKCVWSWRWKVSKLYSTKENHNILTVSSHRSFPPCRIREMSPFCPSTRHEVNIGCLLQSRLVSQPPLFFSFFLSFSLSPKFSDSQTVYAVNSPIGWPRELSSSERAAIGWSWRRSQVSTCALSLRPLVPASVPPCFGGNRYFPSREDGGRVRGTRAPARRLQLGKPPYLQTGGLVSNFSSSATLW